MACVLYLSTDGLTDPLGQSQILPYLKSLANRQHIIYIISLEKPHRLDEVVNLQQELADANLHWVPLGYHKRPPVLATLFDLWRMKSVAIQLGRKRKFEIVHARSYLAGLIGLTLRERLRAKLLFDTRGFWIDERVEGGIWNILNPVYRVAVWWLRKIEKKLYTTADSVVLLTHKAKAFLLNHEKLRPVTSLIQVIPCCADETLFNRRTIDESKLNSLRNRLGLVPQDRVVTYHGSLGTWYMTKELVSFYEVVLERFSDARLLVVSCDEVLSLRNFWNDRGLADNLLITYCAKRDEIPLVLALSSVCVFFIKPVFSKIGSSPTKMAEIICMDVPLVTNSGVGDVDYLFSYKEQNYLVYDFGAEAYRKIVSRLPPHTPACSYPQTLKDFFSLKRGTELYHNLYHELSN